MLKYDTFSKILMSLAILGFSLWFGSNIARTAIGYDIFKPQAELVLKEHYTNEQRMQNIYLFSSGAVYSDIGYLIFSLSLITFAVKQKKYLKQNGWLVMSLILLLLALPVQVYLIYMDYKLASTVVINNIRDFYDWEIQKYFYNRFVSNNWTVASSLSFLCTTTSALCFAWLHLKKEQT